MEQLPTEYSELEQDHTQLKDRLFKFMVLTANNPGRAQQVAVDFLSRLDVNPNNTEASNLSSTLSSKTVQQISTNPHRFQIGSPVKTIESGEDATVKLKNSINIPITPQDAGF